MAAPILHKGTLRLRATCPGHLGPVMQALLPRARLTQESLGKEEALQPAKVCFISKR